MGCRVPCETPLFSSQENMLKQAQKPSKTGCPSSRHSKRWPVDMHLIFHGTPQKPVRTFPVPLENVVRGRGGVAGGRTFEYAKIYHRNLWRLLLIATLVVWKYARPLSTLDGIRHARYQKVRPVVRLMCEVRLGTMRFTLRHSSSNPIPCYL